MDIKKLEGSLSFDDFATGLLSHKGCETYGDVWEACVNCGNCPHHAACEALGDMFLDRGINLSCNQVIDILLGDLKIEEVK